MRLTHRLSASVLVVAVLATGCAGGDEEPGGATVPDGWQVHEFDGGSVATPADWTVGEPLHDDALRVDGPEASDGLPPVLRVKQGDDQVPFDSLMQLFASSLTLQVSELEPLDRDTREVAGAEAAEVADFRYTSRVDGDEVQLRERVVIARAEEGGDVQVRIGTPEASFDEVEDLFDRIIDTLRLDA